MLIKAKGIFLLTTLSLFFLGACSQEEAKTMPPAAQPPKPVTPPVTPVEPEEAKERPVYVYSGDRFKDPFLELGQTSAYQPDAIFNPEQAKVKGIIYSRRLRSAYIQVSGSGSYYITGSRIFDVMGKKIAGFKAKVLPEKVVITGEADDVFELKLRETEEGEEEQL